MGDHLRADRKMFSNSSLSHGCNASTHTNYTLKSFSVIAIPDKCRQCVMFHYGSIAIQIFFVGIIIVWVLMTFSEIFFYTLVSKHSHPSFQGYYFQLYFDQNYLNIPFSSEAARIPTKRQKVILCLKDNYIKSSQADS